MKIHFTAFFLLPLIHQPQMPIWKTLLFAVMILLSIALHELGHTLVAQRYGIKVKDIVLTPIGGVARLLGLPEDPHEEIRIALAGPYVSLALALAGAILGFLSYHLLFPLLTLIFVSFSALNLGFFLFNLLPSFPMDGGRVLRGWLTLKKGSLEATRIASTIGKALAGVFIITGLILHHFSLVIIGGFIMVWAGNEYRMMKLRAWQGQVETGPLSADFEASPPPYAQKGSAFQMPAGLPGDLIRTARDLYEEVCKTLFTKR